VEGKRVSLAEVESALTALPEIQEAAVLLLPGPPVRLAAAVVPRAAGWQALEAQGHFRFGRDLAHSLAPRMESSGRPKLWRFVEALPRRHMGKRDAGALAALFADPPT
jgi:acyl-coenzyme A synthetase/AMP-(fatty) acid ligase